MAVFAATNTFVSGASITAAGHNTNWSDVTTWLNNRYNGTDTWLNMKVSATAANPVDVSGSASTTEVSINNTATDGDPILSFKLSGTAILTMGVDDSASDLFKIGTTAITTAVSMQIPAAGSQVQFAAGTVGAPSISIIGDATSGFYQVSASNIGLSIAGVKSFQWNSTSALALDGSASSPSYSFLNDTNSGFLSESADVIAISLGGTTRYSIGATSFTPVGAGSISTGDASNYWNDISYKTLTDRGCLGWFDEGVELQDGRIVSDCEAIEFIQKHPTKKTVYGVPMLDYSTFPKVSYKKAPEGGSDGIEMTSMQSIMIGAIKQLHNRVKVLEAA